MALTRAKRQRHKRALWRWFRRDLFSELGIVLTVGKRRKTATTARALVLSEMQHIPKGERDKWRRYLARVYGVSLSTVHRFTGGDEPKRRVISVTQIKADVCRTNAVTVKLGRNTVA